ncbi:MAG: aspartate/glutamate racemase family protein [Ilumatobacteraceae bacterium]
MSRILWINPVPFDAFDEPIGTELRSEADPDTRVDVCSLPPVPGIDGPQHLEWNALEAVVAGPTIGVVRWARQQGYDAAVIGCFYDPFLRAAREVAGPMAVTAPAEACLHIASTVGERISILVGRKKWIPEMHENVVKYGFGDRLASFRELRMSVSEFQADPRAPRTGSSKRRASRSRRIAPTWSCSAARSSSASIESPRRRSACR